jgi:adenylate cyclase
MLFFRVINEKQNQHFEHSGAPIELGRGPQRELPRFIIEDGCVSRDHLRVEGLPGARVRLDNLSLKMAVVLGDGSALATGGRRELDLPVHLTVGETLLEIRGEALPAALDEFWTIARPARYAAAEPSGVSLCDLGEAPSAETVTEWMEAIITLQSSAAGPPEFYEQTVEALIVLVGLDVGLILMAAGDSWQVVARASRNDDDGGHGRDFSRTLLEQVLSQRQTFYQGLRGPQVPESLRHLDAVVASPIFGVDHGVAGVLYGVRRQRGREKPGGIRTLEARVVQLLAATVSANLARTTASRTRVQFEQFFSPELVRELERDPDLLAGRTREVTILQSDIRGFSRLSEKLGPQDTCRLVQDVMERLSECVVEHGGAIVVYLGDGLLAMWNAPVPQPDHAARACRAALAMLGELPGLNARWQPVLGRPLALGIGVNTGPAQVGNTGSSRKFMYGPLGNTVNVASRVEGATKQLGVPVLITGSTRAGLGDAFLTRRLCQVRVVGIAGPVDLHELRGAGAPPDWLARRDQYEGALALFEAGQWSEALKGLFPLLGAAGAHDQYDDPTFLLMARARQCLKAPPPVFDPVMELTDK